MKHATKSSRPSLSDLRDIAVIAATIIVIFVVLLAVFEVIPQRTVTGVLVSTPVEGGNTAFVFREDGTGREELFLNNDNWFFLKWNSRDYIVHLHVGQRYSILVSGFRFGLMSWSENIVSYTPLSDTDQ
jgi:hypothetical protein